MKIRLHSIWRFLPVPVITLERMPGRLVGLCVGPFIVVREDYASDYPTIVHELTHCKQFWRGLTVLHLIRYYGSRRYRLKAEVEAFRAELAACTPAERRQRLHESARSLASSYSLGLDVNACRLLLSAPASRPLRRDPQHRAAGIDSGLSMPARLERRRSAPDRREPCRRLPGQDRAPEHNRRRQVDRRRPVGQERSQA
ncbi:MAG TPA: hypothetical protein VEY69_09945 [Lautropia sp.]|nr:hypothetical protein [Lautropia sp.]